MGTMARTKKSNALDYKNIFSVSPEVEALLPDALIDYLWKRALCEEWQNHEKQLFLLQSGELGGRKMQDIYHTCYCGNSMDTRRVYGVEPVNCTLQVFNSQNRYQMSLC